MSGIVLEDVATFAIDGARKRGVKDAKVVAARGRSVTVTFRKGRPDRIMESAKRSLTVHFYMDGRYSVSETNDLRPEALERFLDSAAALTRAMTPDPYREITDPVLYAGRQDIDLKIFDPAISSVQPTDRNAYAAEMETAALEGVGDRAISAEASYQDGEGELVQIHSNGFSGQKRSSEFWASVEVSIRDAGDKRPEGWSEAGSRRRDGLKAAAEVGNEAARDALGRLGASKIETGKMTMIVENRAVDRLLGHLLAATRGRALQQKRSFLEGKLGQAIGSSFLDIVDDPFVEGGFGSRLFDGEGITAKRMPLFEKGVLRAFFIDTYYGKKLGLPPTTGSHSNLVMSPGSKDLNGLVAGVDRGVLVRGFIGGNSNSTTGDFSLGVFGTLIEKGRLGRAVSEMNIAGNHADLWKRLVAVGSDTWPYSSLRVPSLVFDGVQFSGA